jgi:predicted MFS family arabinose efflux permease
MTGGANVVAWRIGERRQRRFWPNGRAAPPSAPGLAIAKVVERGDAVGFCPDTDSAGAADVRVVGLDVAPAVERNGDVRAGELHAQHVDALRAMFVLYGALGLAVFLLYRRPHADDADGAAVATAPLGRSRRVVVQLAALFSVDAFAGGLVVNSLLSLWLYERFGFSLTAAAAFFFWAGLLSAGSQLAAPHVAARIGLLNTMVFTHLPANVCLVLAARVPTLPLALALLFVRSALSQMDVPTRTAYVMAVVTPAERGAAASFTAVPRSLAAALSPTLSGALFAAGLFALPPVGCGVLKIAYDLTLWRAMRKVRLDGP